MKCKNTSVFILVLLMLATIGCAKQGKKVVGAAIFEKTTKTIMFPSEDSVMISADIYLDHNLDAPLIILFHQAGWSRGEYIDIAPKLNKLGFNCIAVDQRSGEKVNNVINKTHSRAATANKSTKYLDAYIDMVSSLKFLKEKYGKGKIIIWGSSYSAALTIRLAGEYPKEVDGVLSFSPGEYFVRFGKPETFISEFAKNIASPAFITSAKNEKPNWENIYNSIPTENKHFFLPLTNGNHGSRALWRKFEDSDSYWNAVEPFLIKYFIN